MPKGSPRPSRPMQSLFVFVFYLVMTNRAHLSLNSDWWVVAVWSCDLKIVKKSLGSMGNSAVIDKQCLLRLQELVLMECMPSPYVSVLSKVKEWVWFDLFWKDLWRPEPKALSLYLYCALFLKIFKKFGRVILRSVESWSGEIILNRLVQEALDNDRFHPWVMRPNVYKVLIGLTAHNRFRKTWSNGVSLRHGGNFRPSISGVCLWVNSW